MTAPPVACATCIDQKHCTATGAIAFSNDVTCEHPRGPTEQLTDLVRVTAGDGQSDELLVVLGDGRADRLGVRLESDRHVDDLETREIHGEVNLHVVHHQRLRIAGNVESGRLLIADGTTQQEHSVGSAVGADAVFAVVDRQVVRRCSADDLVVEVDGHPSDLAAVGSPGRVQQRRETWSGAHPA